MEKFFKHDIYLGHRILLFCDQQSLDVLSKSLEYKELFSTILETDLYVQRLRELNVAGSKIFEIVHLKRTTVGSERTELTWSKIYKIVKMIFTKWIKQKPYMIPCQIIKYDDVSAFELFYLLVGKLIDFDRAVYDICHNKCK